MTEEESAPEPAQKSCEKAEVQARSEQGWQVLNAHRANKLALSIYESETLTLDELRRRHADAPVDEIVARMVANG
ncbi:MAG: hypothetical protein H6837_05825 [Planctomycetes bacterium]|nr:hypothetical protein [Planctomycetota bacterium]